MGEARERQAWLFEPSFQRAVKFVAGDERLTSDGGVLLLREADHRLGLTEALADRLHDPRSQPHIRYALVELLRFRLYALAAGYSAQDDLDRLAHDPSFKLAAWDRTGEATGEERLSSQPTQSRLVALLAQADHREVLRDGLAEGLRRWMRATGGDRPARHATIDLDSFSLEVRGRQEGAAYNGYHRCVGYHPLVASLSVGGRYDSAHEGGRLGDGFLDAVLRPGNVDTAHGAGPFLQRVIARARGLARAFDVRFDAGFAEGPLLDALTDEKVRFLGRLSTNARLEDLAAPYLKRPPGRPPREGREEVFELGPHRAGSWRHAQRLLLVIVDRPDPRTGQRRLTPEHFFLVTNWSEPRKSGPELLAHYRRRGTFEDRLGEFRAAVGPHLSSPGFAENETLLWLALLAYNLASVLRTELEAARGACWDLRRFQQSVLKTGGRLLRHARRWVLVAARAVAPFWEALARRLRRWRLPAPWRPRGPRHRAWLPPPRHAHLALVLRE